MRAFYNLDGLWSDAPRLAAPETPVSDEPTEDDGDDDWI
jgi:hypothetical protein